MFSATAISTREVQVGQAPAGPRVLLASPV